MSRFVDTGRDFPPKPMPWFWTLMLVLLAAVVRVLFYSGYFGSDEVTYAASALRVLAGDWSVATYVGANRLGVNLPMAVFAGLFGVHEGSLAAYSVLCSVAEVGVVARLGAQLVGVRVAFLAAVVLSFLPLHVHSAGRMMADSALSLAITAGFLLFCVAQLQGRLTVFFWSGAALGIPRQQPAFLLSQHDYRRPGHSRRELLLSRRR